MILSFSVKGEAKPKGSKSVGRGGQIYETAKGLKPWMEAVKSEAKRVMGYEEQEHHHRPPFAGPVKVRLRFYMKRPKTHLSATGGLKWWAPVWKQSKPDSDKLARGVLDGLHPWCFKDDSQVVMLEVLKLYCPLGQEPSCHIEIRELA